MVFFTCVANAPRSNVPVLIAIQWSAALEFDFYSSRKNRKNDFNASKSQEKI